MPPGAWPSNPMMPSPAPPRERAMVTSAPAVSDLAVSPSTLAGTRAATDSSGVRGFQLSSRWASRKRSVASRLMVDPSISMRTPVSTGSMSSRPAAVTAWATAWANCSLPTVPAAVGIAGQGGVVLDRHRLQREARSTAGQRDASAVELHLHRLVGQRAADVGEQPAADQGTTLVADVGGQRRACGGLVVERRQHQPVIAGVDHQAGEHRGARADRQAASGPGDGVGEHVALDTELHGVDLPTVGAAECILPWSASGGEGRSAGRGGVIPRRGACRELADLE